MSVTWGKSWRYGDISRTLITTSRSFAVEPQRQRILVAVRQDSGQMAYAGESDELAFSPFEIAVDGTYLYAIGPTGVEKHTQADAPVFTASLNFNAGLGRFVFVQGSYLIVPNGNGGVQTIAKTDGEPHTSFPGVLSEISAACYDTATRRLWLFDESRAKGASFLVGTAGDLTFQQKFSIPNCRSIVRAVFDDEADLIFIITPHRIVSFTTADDWTAPTVSQDFGLKVNTFTDFVKVDTDQYWVGVKEAVASDVLPLRFGTQLGAYDSVRVEMQIACPQVSRWTISNAIPVWSAGTPEDPGTLPEVGVPDPPPVSPDPPPDPPVIILPDPPVITSALTATVTEFETYSYTITATGSGPITYGLTSPPAWITSFSPLTGEFSGTAPAHSTQNIVMTATNAGGTDTKTLVLTVDIAIGNLSALGVNNGQVNAVLAVGNIIYVGGTFTSVGDALGTYTRNRLASFDKRTAQWTSWDPNSTPEVMALAYFQGYIVVGAASGAIGGTTFIGICRIDPTSGVVDTGFQPTNSASAVVRALLVDDTSHKLYVGGTFTSFVSGTRQGMARLSSTFTLDSWYPYQGIYNMTLAGGEIYSLADAGTEIAWSGYNRAGIRVPSTWAVDSVGRSLKTDGLTGTYVYGGYNTFQGAAVAVDSTRDYVGGSFTLIAGLNGATDATRASVGAIDNKSTVASWNPGSATSVTAIYVNPDNHNVWIGALKAFQYDNTGAATTTPTWTGGSNVKCFGRVLNGLIIGGAFSAAVINGATRNRIAIMNLTTGVVY